MKKLITLTLLAMSLTPACSEFDDSKIWDKLNSHEQRIAYLEDLCKSMNADITNIQTIVTALETNDYIVNASPLVTDDGYTFIFKSGKSIVIYNGKNGKDGTNGKDGEDGEDGTTPIIGVIKDVDGVYYWTVNNEWLIINEEKVKASATDGKDGTTPKLKIENSHWYVSYNEGATWEDLGKIPQTELEDTQYNSIFSDIKLGDNSITFTLTDGTQFVVPKKPKAIFNLSEINGTTITFTGEARPISPDYEVGIYYSTDEKVQVQKSEKVSCVDFDKNGNFEIYIKGLKPGTTYYWRSYVSMYGDVEYSEVESFTTKEALKVVKKITFTTTDVYGNVTGWTMDYLYDEHYKPIELDIAELGYGDKNEADKLTFRLSDFDSTPTITEQYNNVLHMEGIITLDDADRIKSIEKRSGEYGCDTEIEYNSDNTQKKVTYYFDYGVYEMLFTYSDSELSSVTDRWIGEDENVYEFEESVYFSNKIPADKVNLDLNTIQFLGIPDGSYTALTHLGYCGNGFTGKYLSEILNREMFFSNFVGGYDEFYGTTDDPEYCKHVTKIVYENVDEQPCRLAYEFDEDGYPVRFTSSAPVKKYSVEYDIIAGEVIYENGEYFDDEYVITYREYELVETNKTKNFLETVYEKFVGEIAY